MAQVSYGTITVSDLTDGSSALTIYLYQRSVNTPNKPTNSPVYTFSTGILNPSPNNSWQTSLSLLGEGSNPIWVTTAVVSSIETSVTLSENMWSTPIKLVENGETGLGIKEVEELYYLQTQALYTVTYQYTNAPTGAPALPAQASYLAGETVTIASLPSAVTGYTFSGWKRGNTVVTGTFSMPEENVVLIGTWTAKTQYTVTYQYIGTVPSGAPSLPAQQTYYAGDTVTVASAPTMSGYNFSGWSRTGTFTINSNITITGSWTSSSVPTYTVTYQYTNAPSGVTPPAQQSYQQNATVTLPTPSSVSDYIFNGWTSSQVTINNNTFTMPAYAVTVTGSWSSTASSDVVVANLSKTLTTASNSIQFTGLSGEPTSFSIIAGSTLTTGASPWKTAMVVYDGTKVIGQTIRNTSNAQVTYDSTGFSKTYNNGTLTITGTNTNFQANIAYHLVYTYNGTSDNIKTKTVQVGSGATTITFTDVEINPEYFSCIFTSNFSSSNGYQRVIGVQGQGGDAYGLEMDSSAKYSDGHWTYSYNNGSLTIRSSGTNQGGYFHQPGYYQLTYVVHNTNNLKSGSSTTNQEVTESLNKGEIEEIVLTKGISLRAAASNELEAPSPPRQVVDTTEDVIDEWTLTIPTYRENKEGTYYSCFQIFYDDDITVNWTNPIKNDALNKSIEALDKSIEALDKSQDALEIAQETEAGIKLLNGAFINLNNSTYSGTPSGAGVVEGLLNSDGSRKSPSAWGFNTWIAANGIQIRKAETVLSSWAVDSNTNRATIQLGRNNNERFVISSDKLEAYGYINGAVQKYFEVSANGMKFGANAGIEAASTDYVTTQIDNIQVGGTNLLLKKEKDYQQNSYRVYQLNLTENLVVGETYTLQFWGVTLDSNSTGLRPYWGGANNNLTPLMLPDANGYCSATFTVNTPYNSTEAQNLWLNIYNFPNGHAGISGSIQKWKLEKGNKATDWSPAPEDVDAEIDGITIGGRNLLRNTQDYIDWYTSDDNMGFISDEPTDIVNFPSISSMSTYQALINTYRINYSQIRNQHCILSMLAKVASGVTISIMWQYEVYDIDGTSRLRYSNQTKTIVGTGNWEKVIFELDVNDSIFTIEESGSSAPDYNNCEIRMSIWRNPSANYTSAFQIKNLKLETGNKVTDWSVAPEDLRTREDDSGEPDTTQQLISANLSLINEFKKILSFEDWLVENGDWIQITNGEELADANTVYYNLDAISFEPVTVTTGDSTYKLFTKQNNVYEPILDVEAKAQSGKTYFRYDNGNYISVSPVTVGETDVYGLYTRNNDVFIQILDETATAQSGTTYYKLKMGECAFKETEPEVTRVYGSYILDLVTTPVSTFLQSIFITNENGIIIQGLNNDTQVQIYSNGISLVRGENNELAFFGESIRLGNESEPHLKLLPKRKDSNFIELPPELSFYDGTSSEPVASISSNVLSIANGILKQSLQIGRFAWKVLGDNRITLIYTD